MLIVTIAGNLGKDAEYKETQGGKGFCSFPVAATVGYGDKKATVWVDVTRWGEGAQGLTRHLRKGSKVTVIGELSTREHNGKTYLQCRADHVALQGDRAGGTDAPQEPQRQQAGGFGDDLDDSIPFISSRSIW
ncbi:MAG: single-stranded DNA-binding protein [Beijerinckiaceae bacterium]